ncbi:MAG TPA: hypothetical protein VM901_01780, partial [Bdellovibrionota bacterium]|nr:hypothetical protein [Bdellovibrionota bacterium]
GSSLAMRIVPATPTSNRQMGVKPNWHVSMIYEYASFTFEPVLQIMELRSDNSFFSGAFYFGYRI